MTHTNLDLTADIIDLRDVISRYEELSPEYSDVTLDDAELEECLALESILDELKGYGGDEQWRGDWYPITLIRDSYFKDYARELLEDCGDIPRDMPSYVAIDWDETADNIRVDYSSVEIDGETYWYR